MGCRLGINEAMVTLRRHLAGLFTLPVAQNGFPRFPATSHTLIKVCSNRESLSCHPSAIDDKGLSRHVGRGSARQEYR